MFHLLNLGEVLAHLPENQDNAPHTLKKIEYTAFTLSTGTWKYVTMSIGTWKYVTMSIGTWKYKLPCLLGYGSINYPVYWDIEL